MYEFQVYTIIFTRITIKKNILKILKPFLLYIFPFFYIYSRFSAIIMKTTTKIINPSPLHQ